MDRKLVLDISMWDKGIDLKTWKEERSVWAVIIKCGGNEGKRYRDPSFEENYKKSIDAGLFKGCYYYTTSTTNADAKADAEHCISLLKDKSLDMPVYMDVEDKRQYGLSKRALTDVIRTFCDTIEAAGYRAGIYVNGDTWMNEVYRSELYRYADWIAWWRSAWPSEAEDGGTIGLWQQGTMRLSDGDVAYDDISGRVDCSWCVVDYPSQIAPQKKDSATPTVSLRDKVVAKAESQLGVRYWTMHTGPKGSGSEGWGCAMLVCWCLNQIFGTKYYGSCWNLWGDAIGAPQYNQGGGEFEVIDAKDAQPGDVVMYFKPNVNIGYSTNASHTALYVGNGKAIGAWGYGTPGTSYYMAGGSVRKTTVEYQSLGGAIRYIRCKRLKNDKPSPSPDVTITEEYKMSRKITFKKAIYVRTSPSTKDMSNVCKSNGKYTVYEKGDTCIIDGIVIEGGRVWGYYTGATSGQRRYVSLGTISNVTVD